MRHLFATLFLFSIVSGSALAQSSNQQLLTVTIHWNKAAMGKSTAVVCTPDGQVEERPIDAKLSAGTVVDLSKALTNLLNDMTSDGWRLISASMISDGTGIQLLIFEKGE